MKPAPLHPNAQAHHPIRRIALATGDVKFADAPTQFSTLLGSCVSVTLWHPRNKLGGMCHFLLPSRSANSRTQWSTTAARFDVPLDGHYADEAFTLLDRFMLNYATHPKEYQAKLFGGGNMFPAGSNHIQVGQRNIDIARKLLEQRKIHLVAEHAGGIGHRKLVFDITSGEVELSFKNLTHRGAMHG